MKLSSEQEQEIIDFYRGRTELLTMIGEGVGLNPRDKREENTDYCKLVAYAFMQRYKEGEDALSKLPEAVREERIRNWALNNLRLDITEGFKDYIFGNGKTEDGDLGGLVE